MFKIICFVPKTRNNLQDVEGKYEFVRNFLLDNQDIILLIEMFE